MPLHTLKVTTEAQQSEAEASTDSVTVTEPILRRVEVFISKDSYTEVRAGVFVGEKRVFPTQKGAFAQKPGTTGPAPVTSELPGTPNSIELRAFAPNADFQHVVIANVEVVSKESLSQGVRIESFEEAPVTAAQNDPDTP